jgi:hypothetical protein
VTVAAARSNAEFIREVNATGEFLIGLLHLMARHTECIRFCVFETADETSPNARSGDKSNETTLPESLTATTAEGAPKATRKKPRRMGCGVFI